MKYLRVLLAGLQTNIHYRANTIGWILTNVVPSMSFIIVWLTALGNRSQIGGFAKGDFIMYFFFGSSLWYIIGGTYSYQMGNAIKDGEINKLLLKPINFTLIFFIREQAWKISAVILSIPFVIAFFYIFGNDIHTQWNFLKVVYLLVSIIVGGTIFALLEALVGLSAFWIYDLWSVIEANDIMLGLFGGRVAPISMMPPVIQNVANFLPYKYIFYTPMVILLDKTTTPVLEIQKQCLFVVILFPIYLILWRWGVRRYEAVGG